ncbi:hypothetical protein PTTG_30670, partial [Puccinia triticina 1-1 BBBD Race 1]
MHTNNYTEAWHLILKSKFILPPERRRIDELTQIFCDVIEPHFSREFYQVDTGFLRQRANLYQQKSKDRADGYSKEHLALIGAKIHRHPEHFYHVNFKPAVGLSKARLLNCTCDHFTRVGSGCLHMYYLAREYRMLVVEEAPSNQHPIDPIYVESDTDVEVVSNGRPRPKRRNSLVFSPRESIVSKRGCFDAPSIPAFSTLHPNLCPPQIEMPTAGTSNGAYSINVLSHSSSPDVSPAIAKKPHFSGNVGKALNSSMMILKRAIEGMKTKKARQAMANVTPPATMNHFQLICNTLLRLVEERSQGHPHTLPP